MQNPTWTRDELTLGLDVYSRLVTADLSPGNPHVVALSRELNALPIHPPEQRDGRFRNPAGVAMELRTFLPFDPRYRGRGLRRGAKLAAEVWREFEGHGERLGTTAAAIRLAYRQDAAHAATPAIGEDSALSDPDVVATEGHHFREGEVLLRLHRLREREPRAVRAKKQSVLRHTGRLACEVCGFDFGAAYGELGHGFAECHHTTPLHMAVGGRSTRLADLAIVCANCHRMLHRARPLLDVAELARLLAHRQAVVTIGEGA